MKVDAEGGYEWNYWHGKGLATYAAPEDFGHATLDVEFAALAARNSLVFTRDDLKHFAAAFYRYTELQGGRMRKPDDGAGPWLPLAEVDCGVYHAVASYLMGKTGGRGQE